MMMFWQLFRHSDENLEEAKKRFFSEAYQKLTVWLGYSNKQRLNYSKNLTHYVVNTI